MTFDAFLGWHWIFKTNSVHLKLFSFLKRIKNMFFLSSCQLYIMVSSMYLILFQILSLTKTFQILKNFDVQNLLRSWKEKKKKKVNMKKYTKKKQVHKCSCCLYYTVYWLVYVAFSIYYKNSMHSLLMWQNSPLIFLETLFMSFFNKTPIRLLKNFCYNSWKNFFFSISKTIFRKFPAWSINNGKEKKRRLENILLYSLHCTRFKVG